MKQVFFFAIALLSATISFAAPKKIKTIKSGDWSTTNNWDLTRKPQDGDTIIVSPYNTVQVTENVDLRNVVVEIYGTVQLKGNSLFLRFDDQTVIKVFTGGKIIGDQSSQQIKLNSYNLFKGNDPMIVGPVYASAATAGTFISIPMTILPVKFVGFSVARQNNDVLVQWSTAEEVAAANYEVERSFDGTTWSKVGTLAAKGNATSLTNYSFTDRNLSTQTAYYRVKQLDIDGRFTYTQVRMIKTGSTLDITVAGINNKVVLQFSAPVKGAVEVRLVSLSGQVIRKQVLNQPIGQVVLNTTAAKGAYIVSVSNAQDIQLAKQVLL